METLFKPPQSLSLEGNVSENWRNFSQKFDLFAEATDLSSKAEAKKVAVFLSLIGDDGLDLYNSFTFNQDEDAKKLADIRKKFEAYCAPKKNVTFERFVLSFLKKKQCKETLHLYPIPERPWERVGVDIFSYAGKSYLVVFDAYSNWLELVSLKNKSTNSKIVTRSPNYPPSNGLAEKGVAISKNLLKKSIAENKDIYTALMDYRNSPLKNMNYTPSQLLMSRMCKTKLPTTADLLKPALCQNVDKKLELKQEHYKQSFNRTAKNLQPLELNNNITVQNHVNKSWESGIVIDKHESPRSYIIQDCNGNVVRRNRIDLRKSYNKYECSNTDQDHVTVTEKCQTVVDKDCPERNPVESGNISADENCTSHSHMSIPNISNHPNPSYITRSGRHVKQIQKLNL